MTFLPQAGPVPSRIPSRARTLALTFRVNSKGQNQAQPGAWSRSPPTGLWSALLRVCIEASKGQTGERMTAITPTGVGRPTWHPPADSPLTQREVSM